MDEDRNHNDNQKMMMVQGTANEIANRIQNNNDNYNNNNNLIQDGCHNLLIYNDISELRKIFAAYAKTFLPKNEIILFATQYDSIDNIKRSLFFLINLQNNTTEGITTTTIPLDISKHIADGTLFIIDAQQGYQEVDTFGTFKLAMTLLSRVKKEKRRGITWFGDMGSFFSFNRICELVDYELFCPTRYEAILKTVCCYHRKDFNNLDKTQQDTLIDHHLKTIIIISE